MSDVPGGPLGLREPASARAAVLEVEVETALSLGRATANALRELSPEASAVFRRQLQRELNRLKLAGPGGPDLAAMRLRAFLD